jgi:PucR family transcriptional regulator, purine catabolism regulatory protein
MASLGDVHDAIFPTARPIRPLKPEDGSREISWVRVMKARVPAFDALEPGDLAIVPSTSLAVMAAGAEGAAGLVEAFARARVPALLLAGGDGGEVGFDALADAADRAGLVVFRIARVDPAQLERSVIGFLVNRRAELDHRAAELEGQLARLALLGRGLDVLVAAIGSFFGRAIVVEGRRGDQLAIHAPAELPAAVAAVTRYLARPSSAVALRVPIPAAPGESGTGGRLVLLGDEPASEFERIAADRIAALLALELARDSAVRQARDQARRGDPLPRDGPPWVVLIARQAQADEPADIAAREETRAELRLLAPSRRLLLRGTSESLELRMVAAAVADDPDGLIIAERLAGFLRRTVAVSRPFGEPGGRPAAEASARATLEASELLGEPPRVAIAARLPAYLMLGNLHNLPDGLRQARALLAPILVGRPETQRRRLATLRAILDGPGLAEAAARLGVHRNTVAYRAGRLEHLGGWDLRDPDLALALEIAVRIVQSEQRDETIRD